MTGYHYQGTDRSPPTPAPHADPVVCGHVHSTGRIAWICTAHIGPPPGQTRGPHVHYYVNRYPTLDTQERASGNK